MARAPGSEVVIVKKEKAALGDLLLGIAGFIALGQWPQKAVDKRQSTITHC